MDRSTAYNLLGLPNDADEAAVKDAYRELAKQYAGEHYDAGPLKDDAARKMDELNEAFDVVMSYLRTGSESNNVTSRAAAASGSGVGRYPAIRQLINTGHVDEALAELTAIAGGASNAEWNFLMGSAYYYKGWLDQALTYFREAVRLEPTNQEYQAALRNLDNSAGGGMEGNPYVNQDPGGAAINCACNTCTMMCCMDACCSMCRGV